jgi:hypothetical protein
MKNDPTGLGGQYVAWWGYWGPNMGGQPCPSWNVSYYPSGMQTMSQQGYSGYPDQSLMESYAANLTTALNNFNSAVQQVYSYTNICNVINDTIPATIAVPAGGSLVVISTIDVLADCATGIGATMYAYQVALGSVELDSEVDALLSTLVDSVNDLNEQLISELSTVSDDFDSSGDSRGSGGGSGLDLKWKPVLRK